MHSRTIDRSIDDVRLLVKGALELVDDVETYHEAGGVVTAKTGFRFGLLVSSYGESIAVALRPRDEGTTEVLVDGERTVPINVGANPERYVLEFLQTLDVLAEYPTADVVELLDRHTREGTKEVQSPDQQADGSSVLAAVLALLLLVALLSVAVL